MPTKADKEEAVSILAGETQELPPEEYAKQTLERYRQWIIPLNETQRKARENQEAIYVLLHGERGSGKTMGAIHLGVEHCYLERNALVAIIVEVTSMAEEGGAWHKLNHEVLPVWRDAIGLEHTEPRLHATSRKPFIWIRNQFGHWCRFINLSMPVESNVADRVKGMEPSMVIVDEAQTLKTDVYFSAVVQQLGRRQRIKSKQKVYYCCNPAGPAHWLYKRFFEVPWDNEKEEYNADYAQYHVPIKENLKNLPRGYYDRVIEATRGDPVEEARMVRGEWIDRPTGRAMFAEYFSIASHVRGNARVGQGIIPSSDSPILVGYDLGPANSSIHFEQRVETKDGMLWLVFDEMNYVGTYTRYADIVPAVLKRMKYWNSKCNKEMFYDHISDNSAFNQRRTDGSLDALTFNQLSDGKISMRAAPKNPGSVPDRTRRITDLLQQNQLLISATCFKTINMFRLLESKNSKPGEWDPEAGLTPKRSIHIHVFDSLSYPIITVSVGGGRYRVDQTETEIVYIG